MLLVQHATGAHAGNWECTGEKIEIGETQHAALVREIYVELGDHIRFGQYERSLEVDVGTKRAGTSLLIGLTFRW